MSFDGFHSLSGRAAFGAALLLAFAGSSFAANPKDVRKAKERGGITECVRCDLSGAKFPNSFLQLAQLYQADMTGATFDGANMAGTALQEAKLARGSFIYTNFSGARLEGADATGANFEHAWFNWAWFAGAKLDGANFAGANMRGAQLYNSDLSKAIGLTQRQIDFACGDSTTKLPPGIRVPACLN